VAVTLHPFSEEAVAEIVTPSGTLRCADCLLEIALSGRAARRSVTGEERAG
jgi:hypothetical protein